MLIIQTARAYKYYGEIDFCFVLENFDGQIRKLKEEHLKLVKSIREKSRGGGRLLQVDFPFTQTKGSPHKPECMYNVIYNNKLIYLYKNIFKKMNLGGFY